MKNDFQSIIRNQLIWLVALLLLFSPLLLLAKNTSAHSNKGVVSGGSISDGTATYTISSYTSIIGLENDLTISDGVAGDLMFESGWLYRVPADTEENVFPAPDSESFAVDQVLLSWSDVDSRGLFSAELLIEINQPVAQSAVLTSTMVITNITAIDGDFDVFKYADLDVGGTFANDVAALIISPDYIEIIDGTDFAEFRGGGANNYHVSPFSALRTLLIDVNVNNFSNSGLPMVAGDFTGAYQWATQTIPPNGTYHLQTITAFKTTAPEPMAAFVDLIFANGYE